jgi:hypothetical protein
MDKQYHSTLKTWLHYIKPWHFLVIALLTGTVSVLALRHDNLQMVALRNQVYSADKNNGDVVLALQNLQVYVTTHMNTELANGPNGAYPPIQLVYSYDRAVQAAGSAASATNSQLYTNAEYYCQKLDPTDFSGHNRVPCVEQYVENHGASLPNIPVSLYEFDFISPIWSPDLAGWTLLFAGLSLLAAIGLWLKRHALHWFKRKA